jgi:hypothetical protein
MLAFFPLTALMHACIVVGMNTARPTNASQPHRTKARARRLETERQEDARTFAQAGRCECGLSVEACAKVGVCQAEHTSKVNNAFVGL